MTATCQWHCTLKVALSPFQCADYGKHAQLMEAGQAGGKQAVAAGVGVFHTHDDYAAAKQDGLLQSPEAGIKPCQFAEENEKFMPDIAMRTPSWLRGF